MRERQLFLYHPDLEFCEYLRGYDNNVPYVMDGKSTKKFVGVILDFVDSLQYFAPLRLPKEKHLKMKNAQDFLKIEDGKLGAINFNNMIPVSKRSFQMVDLSLPENDDGMYQHLLID